MQQKLPRCPILNVITLCDILPDAVKVANHEETGDRRNRDA
jgi:hypothetical protein